MTLTVWMDDRPVAELTDAGPGYGLALQYTPEAIAAYGEGSVVLSVRLPVRKQPYPSVQTTHFLEGLLPEEHVRAAMADKARVSSDDTYGLLRAYGLDCAGAVQIKEGDANPAEREPSVHWLDDDELAQAVAALPSAPLGINIDPGVRSSLGGLQGKLTVVVDGKRIGVPVNGEPSTHILKPARLGQDGQEQWPGIPAAECFCLQVIRESRTHEHIVASAAAATVLDIAGRKAVLVERFDRHRFGTTTTRVHQEDFGQALGIKSKYQQTPQDPPRLVDVANLLADHSDASSRIALLERVVFTAVLGDCDMHIRNLTVVLANGTVSLSPAYDVVPTSVWPSHSRELALRIGHAAFIDEIDSRDLVTEGTRWGLRTPLVRSTVYRTLSALKKSIPIVLNRSTEENWHHPILDRVASTAEDRIEHLTA